MIPYNDYRRVTTLQFYVLCTCMLCLNIRQIRGIHWPLQWRHNERDGVSNHRPEECLLKRLFMCRSKKTSKLRVIGLCEGNSPVTGEFPTQRASNAENVSIWWRHHVYIPREVRYVAYGTHLMQTVCVLLCFVLVQVIKVILLALE